MMDEDVLLKYVSSEEVFNLPLYEHYLVIDTRSRNLFEEGHIATAVSYPAPDLGTSDAERETTLYRFAQDYAHEFSRPENANPVVIYGAQEGGTSYLHARWLADKLIVLQRQRRSLVPYDAFEEPSDEEDTYDPTELFYQTVADRVKEIWLLEGGYEAFLSQYPFLCGDIAMGDLFPVPHQITCQLWLGSRVVPLSHDTLSKMAVSHVILAEDQKVEEQDLRSVVVLKCSVGDRNEESMIPCWEACCQFIDHALLSGGRVLVLLHGRSRSTSVIMAHLIRKHGLTAESAWQQVSRKCWHLIDRTLIYEPQLHDWTKKQLQALPER